jgi:hypothetical protein
MRVILPIMSNSSLRHDASVAMNLRAPNRLYLQGPVVCLDDWYVDPVCHPVRLEGLCSSLLSGVGIRGCIPSLITAISLLVATLP